MQTPTKQHMNTSDLNIFDLSLCDRIANDRLRRICRDEVGYPQERTAAYRTSLGIGENNATAAKTDQLPPPNPQKSPGLGDAVSSALSLVGITEERVSSWLGAPCGCSERREKLNRIGAWAARVLLGERSEPPLS